MRDLLRRGLRRLEKLRTTTETTAVDSSRPRYAHGRRAATTIAVTSQKGGVGKTTTSVLLADALARFCGAQVLIIDLDAQGHVHESLRQHVQGGSRSLSEVLLSSSSEAEVLDAVVATDIEGLYITARDAQLGQTEALLSTRIGKEFALQDAIRATRTHYDIIIIDCPPNLGTLTLNAVVAADYVLAPCDASPLAIDGVRGIVDTLLTIEARLRISTDLLGILLTRVDGRNARVNAAVSRELAEAFDGYVLEPQIGVDTSVVKAQLAGTSLFSLAPESRAAQQYMALARAIAEQLGVEAPGATVYRHHAGSAETAVGLALA